MIALGGNLPFQGRSPTETLRRAIRALAESGLTIRRISRFFSTPCFPPGVGPDYVNAVICADAPEDPARTLAQLHDIEERFGRARETRWGMRTLDLDLVAQGDLVCPDLATHAHWRSLAPGDQATAAPDRLILPHPRLQDRAFVLVPMCDVAPDWVHPVLGQTARQLLAALPSDEIAAIRPV